MGNYSFVIESFIAGIVASFACGLGVLPLLFSRLKIKERIGLGYGFAGGLMFSASFYNLLLPAFTLGNAKAANLANVLLILFGVGLGCLFLWFINAYLTPEKLASPVFKNIGGKKETLIFLAMTLHSIPEGVAVGVAYASETHIAAMSGLGIYIALAIAIHNIPEGLAVALPLHANGTSIHKCFWIAFLTSLPQPIAAIPAALLVWFFEPLMLPFFGFAAGAMMYLVLLELIPDALEHQSRSEIATSFMIGFSAMALIQVAL